MAKNKTIPYKELLKLVRQKLEGAGIGKEHAFLAAEAICTASLRGTDTHGIRLLPHYLQAIKSGRINNKAKFVFKKTSHSTGILDADHGIAHAALAIAMDYAIKLAKKSGTGFVSVKNSNHCGAMAYYALRACKQDMIGLAFTNATPTLQTFNSSKIFFGTNPICFTAPMQGEEPFCYDASPSVMSKHKLNILVKQGKEIAPGIAADERGEMTTNPNLVKMLIPLGGALAGYKGLGMTMMADILCSLLSGMPGGKDVTQMYESGGANISDKRYLGQFVGAIRIDAFTDLKRFKKRLKETADAVRSLPKVKGAKVDVMIPGDPEKKMEKERLLKGIFVAKNLFK